ncbi:hypothetical protein NDU88_003630 [Pleurodeles waltl]|uniref:Uncharacterized protein n=1 Tax=Pleurodeles waltl TaxID=8319 RepID=A0AAV7M3Y3_PLEWA|nr:hypothetical protein NDU88_003630 [Pleurodeles waltl]
MEPQRRRGRDRRQGVYQMRGARCRIRLGVEARELGRVLLVLINAAARREVREPRASQEREEKTRIHVGAASKVERCETRAKVKADLLKTDVGLGG